MKACELKTLIANGAIEKNYSSLYQNPEAQKARFLKAIDEFSALYGEDRDICIFSVPGRSEISGNHTDHNGGCVLAGAIDRDIIAIASKNDNGVIRFKSEGYNEDVVELSAIDNPDNFPKYKSVSLIAGLAKGFKNEGYAFGGYDAYSTTQVLKGSGISSSAAFEVMIGNVLNYLYNDGKVENIEIAKLAQFAENAYFGKPCGLMDQMACAVGGFVYIDFEDNKNPIVEPISDPLGAGNYSDLNDDYASVPYEMKSVAKEFGKKILRGITEGEIVRAIPALREKVGDRAILRAIHFIRENARVGEIRNCLKAGDIEGFFSGVIASGASSFKFLQNVYTTINVKEQGLSLALALTEGFLCGKGGAYRVHGGGFAGTIQAFVPDKFVDEYAALMNSVFGEGAVMKLRIRNTGATKLF